jgi:tetratricopeptide (TPR) repeat protein
MKLLILLFLFSISEPLIGQTPSAVRVNYAGFNSVIGNGRTGFDETVAWNSLLPLTIQSFYKADWAKTKAALDGLKKIDSSDPMPYFMEAMIPFWAYFFGGMDSQKAKDFLDLSEVAIKITENRLNSIPEDTSSILLLSGLHGYRSLVAAQEKRYGIAMSSGATGYGYTKSLMRMDNDNPNTLMGQGVFHYMVGSIPSEVRWMARLAGLSGDKQHGFMLLERAAESDSYVSNDAKMFLAYLYNRDGQFVKAHHHLNSLVALYPTNPIFHYNLGQVQESLGNLSAAQVAYANVVRINSKELSELTRLSKERLSIIKK